MNPINVNQNLNPVQDSQLASLKGLKSINTEEGLKKAATQFEAVFVSKLLNVMDSTVERSGFLSGGKNEKMFKSMMHQQIAQDIASNPSSSIGLAKQIYEQMKDLL